MAGDLVSKTVAIDWFITATYNRESSTIDEYTSTAEPAVQANSRLEISGDIYEFTGAEAITGWGAISNSTQAYIKFVPAGSTCTVEFTDTPPAWSDLKQGWYDSNDRYLFAVYKDGSGLYTKKALLAKKSDRRLFDDTYIDGDLTVSGSADIGGNGTPMKWKTDIAIGDWDMDTIAKVAVDLGVTVSKVRIIHVMIIGDANSTWDLGNVSLTDQQVAGGTDGYAGTSVDLRRVTGGNFDSTAFNQTSFNRGYVTIGYVD